DLAVVADRQGRTNFHRALRGRRFSVAFWLLGKIDGRLVVVRFQKVRSFFETSATHRAGRVDVPGTGNIQRLFAVFVGHIALLLTSLVRGNFFCGGGSGALSREVKYGGEDASKYPRARHGTSPSIGGQGSARSTLSLWRWSRDRARFHFRLDRQHHGLRRRRWHRQRRQNFAALGRQDATRKGDVFNAIKFSFASLEILA